MDKSRQVSQQTCVPRQRIWHVWLPQASQPQSTLCSLGLRPLVRTGESSRSSSISVEAQDDSYVSGMLPIKTWVIGHPSRKKPLSKLSRHHEMATGFCCRWRLYGCKPFTVCCYGCIPGGRRNRNKAVREELEDIHGDNQQQSLTWSHIYRSTLYNTWEDNHF